MLLQDHPLGYCSGQLSLFMTMILMRMERVATFWREADSGCDLLPCDLKTSLENNPASHGVDKYFQKKVVIKKEQNFIRRICLSYFQIRHFRV